MSMYGNGRHALADALDICTTELNSLIDRHFTAHRELIVEREGNKWTAAIGDDVLFRSPDGRAVLRFARTFCDRTPGVDLVVTDGDPDAILWVMSESDGATHSVRVDADNVVPIR